MLDQALGRNLIMRLPVTLGIKHSHEHRISEAAHSSMTQSYMWCRQVADKKNLKYFEYFHVYLEAKNDHFLQLP